jgi:hypothetical protein
MRQKHREHWKITCDSLRNTAGPYPLPRAPRRAYRDTGNSPLLNTKGTGMPWRLAVGFSFLAALLGLAAGCHNAGPPSAPQPAAASHPIWFRDDSAAVGLDFCHEAGPLGPHFLPQIIGSGAALLDYDNDGRYDLYFVQNGGPDSTARNKLYHQLPDGRFQDASAGSGLDITGHGMGVAVGDFDNDGFVDVYVSQYGGGRLFRNRGDGTFEDVTQAAGVAQPCWGTSCCFVDYDRDGWLDLVVVNYVEYDPGRICGPATGKPDYCHPSNFSGQALRLFHNRGRDDGGKWRGYEDVTEAAGLLKRGPGLGVVCADFNGDGWPDILVANDAQPNYLWINRHDGTFVDEALARGLAYNSSGQAQGNMGIALGDVYGAGRFDLFIAHLTEETHTLWLQTKPGVYDDRTVVSGLAAPRWRGTGFGTVFADFDLDGALDLAVVNGRVSRTRGALPPAAHLDPYWIPYAERNQLFSGNGKGRFADISPGNSPFCGGHAVSRGLVWGCFQNDGGVDLVATTVAGPARFYRNVAPRKGHWLLVQAVDPALHRDAYGAIITLQTSGRSWVGQINPGQSYLSSGDPRAHFGLGDILTVDQIRVSWPDGSSELFPGGPVDRILRLERGSGKKVGP